MGTGHTNTSTVTCGIFWGSWKVVGRVYKGGTPSEEIMGTVRRRERHEGRDMCVETGGE